MMGLHPRPRRTLCGLLLATSLVAAAAQAAPPTESEDPILSGGMALNLTPLEPMDSGQRGALFGLGGRIHVNVLRYLRLGLLGFGASMTYGSLESDLSNAAAGGTVQARIPILPVELAVGVLVGGESITAHDYLAENGDGTFSVRRTEASGFLLNPFLDVEVTFIRRMKLVLTVQLRHATWLDDLYEPTVTFHVGLLFNSYRSG